MGHRIRWIGTLGGTALAVGLSVAQPLPPVGPLPPVSMPEPPLKTAVSGSTFEPIQLPPTPSPLPVPTKPAPTLDPNRVIVGKLIDSPPQTPRPTDKLPATTPLDRFPNPIAPLAGMPTLDPNRVIVGTLVPSEAGTGGLGNPGVGQPKLDAAPASQPATKPLPFELLWNNGLFVQTPKKEFVAHLGGIVQYDGAWYTGGRGVQTFPGGVGRFSDGVSPRRLRLIAEGSFYSDLDYKFDVEFANGVNATGPATAASVSSSPIPLDAWVTLKQVPLLGNVRIGNQKEWFSLEHLSSARALEFQERSYLFDFSQPSAFNNGRSPGVSAFRTFLDERVFTAIGAYKNESDLLGFGLNDGQYAVTGRVAGLPAWDPANQFYWHVGGAMSHRDPVDDAVRVRIRNSVRNAPAPLLNLIADTGSINSTAQDLFNVESAAAWGPLTVSAEYTANLIHGARVGTGPNLGTLRYQGFYTEGLVLLTGEHRTWDPKTGVFKRVIPKKNLSFPNGTYGAVEVGTRYTYLDLDDRGVNGGRLNDVTVGLTWYWNPNVRLQVNYDYVYRDGGANPLAKGSIHSLGTRLAMDF